MSFSPLSALAPSAYLAACPIIEVDHPEVRALGAELRSASDSETECAHKAFEWVRDNVAHSFDARDPRVTLRASEVLDQRVGLCYAKSHLLAAILRGNGIPTALCYQRLTHGDGHVLHGLVAVHLEGAWHRQDPRGNRADVSAEFALGEERLAFPVDPQLGEVDYPELHRSPAEAIINALSNATDILAIYDQGLPSHLGGPISEHARSRSMRPRPGAAFADGPSQGCERYGNRPLTQ
ncbi:transglutaminase family protein [Nocardia sp. PE-7]|uniref:transglutaminase-like domain-containing protein n=1 Tax=Nocardia sp. PE-7 TaxID=3058426 RepID=UPI0026583DB0|nr:transglutaminase family protein [Nocardia sp. PE-7]WKG12368.1 transglutaminase family protein [Nocardia sp. PE-7]